MTQPGWPGRKKGGLALGLMEPELGSLGELWIKGGAGFQKDKGSSSGLRAAFGVEEGTARCDCIQSLSFIQDGDVTDKDGANHPCTLTFSW